LIKSSADLIDDVVVSLDTHQKLHIAHPLFWKNKAGEHPPPFTPIEVAAVESGEWAPSDPAWKEWGLAYVQTLAANERFSLFIWPEHCLIGTKGHAVVASVSEALDGWCDRRVRAVEYVVKGNNMLTEHYSALAADVQRPDDPNTQFNHRMLERLRKADRVLICGEALSHCVAFTVRDLVAHWPAQELGKLVLLTDCASAVPGFEKAAEDFVAEVTAAGVTVTTSDKLSWA